MEKNVRDVFICPKCAQEDKTEVNSGKGSLIIKNMGTMFDDTVTITMECKDCGTIWKTYLKASDFTTEVLYVPNPEADKPVEG